MMTEKSESERAQKPFSCTIDRCFLKATKELFFRDRMQTIPVLTMVQALHEICNLMTSVPSIYFNTMGCADWDLWRSNSATALANRIAECQCHTFPLCTSADFCITTHCALMYYCYTSISQVHQIHHVFSVHFISKTHSRNMSIHLLKIGLGIRTADMHNMRMQMC